MCWAAGTMKRSHLAAKTERTNCRIARQAASSRMIPPTARDWLPHPRRHNPNILHRPAFKHPGKMPFPLRAPDGFPILKPRHIERPAPHELPKQMQLLGQLGIRPSGNKRRKRQRGFKRILVHTPALFEGSSPELVDKKYGFLFSVLSTLQASAGSPVIEGVAVSAGRGVGKGRWRPGKAAVRSLLSRDRVGFRWTRSGSIDTCFCRDSRNTNGCRVTGIPGGGKPLEPGRPRSRWRQTLATPEPLQGSPANAPLGSPRLTRPAPANREEEPVGRNSVQKKHTGNLSENLLPIRILRSSNVRCYPRILVRDQKRRGRVLTYVLTHFRSRPPILGRE